MNELKKTVLREWLLIEFYSVARNIGFIDEAKTVSDKLIMKTIRCLDHETSMIDNPNINYVITIIALMWEHTNREQFDLRKIVVKFLSRVGYPTSAIIADEGFDKKDCVFSSLESFMEELLSTLNQERNCIEINGHKYLLTKFQTEIWNSMDTDKLIGISAPTSAGKSFVILLKLLSKIVNNNFDIVYIVPTLSLLNQVSEDFNKTLKELHIEKCKVTNSFVENLEDGFNRIFVLTQEKAISAFSDERNTFSKKVILVADEIQNIERIKEDNDERAKVLFDTLNEFRYKDNVEQIIISGPRIEEIDKVGEMIFGIEAKDLTCTESPVLNMTYSICKERNKYFFKQYCALLDSPFVVEIKNSDIIVGYGQKLYNEKYLQYLNYFVSSLGNQQNIIFSPTTATARNIACSLNTNDTPRTELLELIEYYKASIHPCYAMCDTLSQSVAYHHGKLPNHVRRTIEKAISNKWINNIACTTTLLQGVNLPTQNIIIRNPHLYLRKKDDKAELTNYEMANLRGRAGRLLKDFVGRTFVLDETSFLETEGYDQISLFDDEKKDLPGGYGERFDKYKDDIEQVILTNEPISKETFHYGDMVSYIRQSILRYGKDAKERMSNVGINLTKEQVAAIIQKLNVISVPKSICYKNRYWDPIILDYIYNNYPEGVPNHPKEYGAKAKLDRMLKFLRDTPETSVMYQKHIPEKYRNGSWRSTLCNLCMKWSKEDSLFNIIESMNYSDEKIADDIEDTIDLLQNTVSYNVPLLLKPIFDIKNPNSSFLACMQAGACDKISKTLIELGVPRECALYLKSRIFTNANADKIPDEELENYARETLQNSINELPFWIKVQLEFLG